MTTVEHKATLKRVARRSSGYALGLELITRRSQVRILAPLLKGENTAAFRLRRFPLKVMPPS